MPALHKEKITCATHEVVRHTGLQVGASLLVAEDLLRQNFQTLHWDVDALNLLNN